MPTSIRLASLALVLAVPATAMSQTADGYTFGVRVRLNSDMAGDMALQLKGQSLNGTTRLDPVLGNALVMRALPTLSANEVVLFNDTSTVIINTVTSARSDRPMESGPLARIVRFRAEGNTVTNVQIKLDSLGDGGVVLGHPTRKYRMSVDYQTFRDGGLERTTSKFDLWIGEILIPNPLDGLIHSSAYTLRYAPDELATVQTLRKRMGPGAVLKLVITTQTSDESGSYSHLQTMELTDLRPAKVEPAAFRP